MESIYLILPGCDDTNRGDQALIWETIRLAKDAGFNGKYYMLASEDKSKQSIKKNIGNIEYILPHPSIHFKTSENIKYTKALKIKWASVALIDLLTKSVLLSPFFRNIFGRFYGRDVQETLDYYKRASAAFVKGGGFLHAKGGLSETYKIFYFLYHINLAISFGCDVYVMPNSFGPFDAPFVKRMLRKTLSKCKVVLTRESISNEVLKKQCKISAVNMPDLAFYLPSSNKENAMKLLIEKGIPIGEKKCVAITVRPYRFPGKSNAEELYQKYLKTVSEFIIWLTHNNYFPVLIEHVSCELSHENDMCAIESILNLLGQENACTSFSCPELDCEEMKAVYSCFDYTVGTRFHSVIFSLSEGVPSIAMTYGGNKGKGIMRDIGIEEFSVALEEINPNKLISMFDKIVINENEVRKKIETVVSLMDKKRKKMIDLLK